MFVWTLLVGLCRGEEVVVASNVQGAAIFLNGVDTGQRTPATVEVHPGALQISVRSGCMVGSATLRLLPHQDTKLSLFAEEVGGTLLVRALPVDAALLLDESLALSSGQEVAVACGGHRLRASREGYEPTEVVVQIAPNGALEIPLALQPVPTPAPAPVPPEKPLRHER